MRANFSKEQPVWLLGRCYHRKFSSNNSMETSMEMTTSLENNMPSHADIVHHQHDELVFDPIVQELGTDATESEHREWEDGWC